METVNPTTGEVVERYREHDEAALTERLARAWARWQDDWQHRPLGERLEVLSNTATILEKRRDELAALITIEMGKPIAAARAEVDKCALLCRHYAEHSAAYLEPERYETEAERSYVRFDPLGPIFAIMPWNFPLWQVFRFAVPNLAAGNVGLLKHASSTTGCGLAVEDVLAEAGLPEGGFTTLLIGHATAAEITGDPRVRGVTLTGSDRAGRAVASSAGKHLKKTVLELGGSDPCIVLDDADLDEAAKAAVASRYLNSGQSCINAKRIIVARDVYEDFIERFRAQVEALAVGDPTDEATDVGPLARGDLRDTVDDQVRRTLDHPDGGTLLLGGEPLDGPGFFYAPTVIRDVDAQAPAATEEVFGPVAALIDAEHDEAAVAIANSSRFGLGAAIWTTDLDRGERIAGRVESGMVFINEIVKSDPRLPFGGVKDSGYGRELAGQGLREFTNAKTVWVSAPSGAAGASVE
ncbi:MAG: aldehyde dehydrogenase family protein [Nitriliruptorales bacterium]|nr:aldehyde dehydrogenase family protein [Nitriliruptorales bacterium]